MSDITLIDDSEQSSLVTNGLAKNGELYLKKAGSTDAGSIVVYDSGVWKTFANEYAPSFTNAYSVNFDGSNDYVDLTAPPSSDFNFGTGDFGLSMWVKADSISSPYHGVLGSYGGGPQWQVFIGSAGLSVWNGALKGGGTINTGTWYHCVATRSSGVLKTYINGLQNSSDNLTSAFTPSSTGSFRIGGPPGGTFPHWDGLIDEVAIFNSGLSASNVTDIYNLGVPTDISSLNPLGWWRMGDDDSGTGTTITDQGSGGNDGTLTNGPTFSSDVPS